MATITLHGDAVETIGELPAVGNAAPAFTLTNGDLGDSTLADFSGKPVILNIYPSIDTGTCAASTHKFNEIAKNEGIDVVCVSADLPFAQGRFCGAEGLDNVKTVSTFRNPEFGSDYGVVITTGVLKGLMSRAVVVIDATGNITHTEQVGEIADEPNYDAALAAAKA